MAEAKQKQSNQKDATLDRVNNVLNMAYEAAMQGDTEALDMMLKCEAFIAKMHGFDYGLAELNGK